MRWRIAQSGDSPLALSEDSAKALQEKKSISTEYPDQFGRRCAREGSAILAGRTSARGADFPGPKLVLE